jgi:foldase protein PrsA
VSRFSGTSKRTAAIVGGAILLVLIVAVGVASGLGDESVDSDSVAVVDGDQIPKSDFDAALQQAVTRQQLPEAPAEDSPEFEALRDEAMNQVLDVAWILGEAEERGVEVSDREVQQEFEQTKNENFKTEQEYQDFLKESGFTQEDIDERVKLQLLSTKIQDQITEEAPKVTDSEIQEFYDANKEQLQQPASRDIRLVLSKDEKGAQDAADALGDDNSPESWDEVAKEFSSDDATKDSGGVRAGVTQGTYPEPLNTEIFGAAEGEVVGPIETPDGFYVFQVDAATEESVQPLEEAKPAIQQQLEGQLQQESFSAFLSDYRDRWTELTICGEDYLMERCDNFDGPVTPPCPDPTLPEEQQKQQLEQQGCPPPVLSNSPAAPGSILPFIPAQGQPQRPHPPGEEAPAATGLPGGLPGGVVPGGAPPGGAPPGGAPQGGAPQGGAPQAAP